MIKHRLLAITVLLLTCVNSYGNALYKVDINENFRHPDIKIQQLEGEISFAQFRKQAQVQISRPNIITDAGEIKFKFRLDHSLLKPLAGVDSKKLRNQHLLKITRSDRAFALCYLSVRGKSQIDLRFGVFDSKRKAVYFITASKPLEVNRWYDCQIQYGDKTTLMLDGKVVAEQQISGLFGNMPPGSVTVLDCGNKSWENVFSLSELEIKSRYRSDSLVMLPQVQGEAPRLDGKLDDAFYQNCVTLSGFTLFKQGVLAPEQPLLKIGYNEQGIYFAAEIPMPRNMAPRANQTAHDSRVYSDDAFEVRLQNFSDHHKTFITNCIGTRHESITYSARADVSFNTPWQSVCRTESDRWFAEVFIPWQAMNEKSMPKPGSRWRGNFYFDRAGGFGSSMTWVPTDAMFENRDGFGELVFAGSVHALGVTSVKNFLESQPIISMHKPGSRRPAVTVYGELLDSNSRTLDRFDFRMSDTSHSVWQMESRNAGTYGIILQASDSNDQILLKQKFFFKSDPRPALEVENYPYNGYMTARVRIPGGLYKKEIAQIRFLLQDKKEKTLETVTGRLLNGTAGCRIPTAALSAGEYKLKLELVDSKNQLIDTIVHQVKIAPRPEWFGNNLFIDHSVPPPWTPVEISGTSLKVWNREYNFNRQILPRAIINGGSDLFSRPLKLTLKLKGQDSPLQLDMLPMQKSAVFPDVVTYSGEKNVGNALIKLQGKLEFDGCFRGDLEIVPLAKDSAVIVESLTMQLNIAKQWGQYFLAGAQPIKITDKAIRRRFTPNAFVGNENGGLALFFESSEYWSAGNDEAVLIKRQDDGVLWRCNIITQPRKIVKPMHLVWGLIAAPVKDSGAEDLYRFSQHQCHAEEYAEPAYIRYDRVQFPDNSGSIEFMLRKADSTKSPHWEIMRLTAPGCNPVIFYLNSRDLLSIYYNHKTVAAGKLPINHRQFVNMTVNYDDKNITVLANGKKICAAPVNAPIRELWKKLKHNGTVFIGSADSWRSNRANWVVDEVRLSRVPGNGSAVIRKAAADADTLIADHLDDTFVPDGFATQNLAGGVPSIGSTFVRSSVGNALKLQTAPPEKRWKLLQKDYYTDVAMFWNWNSHHTRQYQWPPAFFMPERPELKKETAAAAALGMRPVPYAVFPAIRYPSDLAEQFGAEWCVKPVNLMPYAPPAGHAMLSVSMAAKGWVDYLTAGIAKSFERYNWRGIYTDGAVNVLPTSNAAYNCGYTDEKGVRHTVYPYFAVREGMKRIYKLVKSQPDRFIINHVSFEMPLMTASFSDAVLAGEHEVYTNMDMIRMRYNRRPWGIPILLFGNSEHDWSALCTMSGLLIGDQIWGMTIHGRNEMERKWAYIRGVYEKFQYRQAEFLPFYEAEASLTGKLPENVHCAAYKHHGKKVMLIIANYNKNAGDFTIPLNLSGCGFTGKIKAQSALNGKALPVKNNTITVRILPENFQIVIIEPK